MCWLVQLFLWLLGFQVRFCFSYTKHKVKWALLLWTNANFTCSLCAYIGLFCLLHSYLLWPFNVLSWYYAKPKKCQMHFVTGKSLWWIQNSYRFAVCVHGGIKYSGDMHCTSRPRKWGWFISMLVILFFKFKVDWSATLLAHCNLLVVVVRFCTADEVIWNKIFYI